MSLNNQDQLWVFGHLHFTWLAACHDIHVLLGCSAQDRYMVGTQTSICLSIPQNIPNRHASRRAEGLGLRLLRLAHLETLKGLGLLDARQEQEVKAKRKTRQQAG